MSNQNIIYKLSVPYAQALLELAKKNNVLIKSNQDCSLILETLSSSVDLKVVLSNPLVSMISKKNMVKQIFQNNVDDFILNFLFVLIDRRRIFLLDTIIQQYFELSYQYESTVVVQVLTATALNEMQQNALIEKIRIITNSKNVKLVVNIDSSLIGGFIIKIGSKIIDTSLSGKLKQVSLYLNQF